MVQSLAVADKAAFRNCLVAMRPNARKADIPSSHDVSTFIHNSFIELFKTFRLRILDGNSGLVSTTTDLWSVDQTKASFMGITAHWIESDPTKAGRWTLCSEVIAFRGISGPHSGINLGRYFVGLCERAGIITSKGTKVR